ncbi:MAG: hypothetical protein DSY90_13405 [Deltaproteobacteria bacterium]|nr:MAG: hypothetical protein DSY90_13405 [Deltaproteobacteria bacterium]
MEKFSPITDSVNYTIPAYIRDHRLGYQAVLPAVEALRILSDTVLKHRPQTDVTRMRDIAFSRLLPVGADDTDVDLRITIQAVADTGDTRGTLSTRFTSRSGTITRMKEHISAVFAAPGTRPNALSRAQPVPPGDMRLYAAQEGFSVSADRLYRELVPFGPGFQSLTGHICLFPTHATGMAGTPATTRPAPGILGSPFPLDAAFHVACAWGQRYARIVAYPVAIRKRTIFKPTAPDEQYAARVQPLETSGGRLSFDIRIESLSGEIVEAISGVEMRPISGVSTGPPDWIIA